MRLYLSSFRVGRATDRLLELAGASRQLALVPNALDGLPDDARRAGLARDVAELSALEFDVTITDLRDRGSAQRLAEADIVWVRGGNVFVLRRALADTGIDRLLEDLIVQDTTVYGGYSAGVCVLSPSLRGLDRVDDVSAVTDPIWSGLGVLDRPFVPHVDSPGHPETADCDVLDAALTGQGVRHWALRDGEVLVIDGDSTEVLG